MKNFASFIFLWRNNEKGTRITCDNGYQFREIRSIDSSYRLKSVFRMQNRKVTLAGILIMHNKNSISFRDHQIGFRKMCINGIFNTLFQRIRKLFWKHGSVSRFAQHG